jgi:two-component system nitrogen regulation response regulator NtrX
MSTKQPTLLICDDDSLYAEALKKNLQGPFEVLVAKNGDETLDALKKENVQAVLLDIQMRTPQEGLDYLPKIRALDAELPIIMLTGHAELPHVRKAMQLGAWDFLSKNSEPIELRHTIEMALDKARIIRRSEQKSFELATLQKNQDLIGVSPAMARVRSVIERVRSAKGNVLISGETGTGKEVVARQLRKKLPSGELEPFIAIDSSTIQSSTAESILFGHQKGAFTGADQQRKGIFEEADGGIVYFDELANMSIEIQAKLLRVVQEKEVMRLGASKPISVDFRVVCATNKDLEKLVTQGQFKEDLLQRLNVLPIELPPLRSRTEDIEGLFVHFMTLHGAKAPKTIDKHLLAALKSYEWPGNVRELSNTASYAIAMSDRPEQVTLESLPPKLLRGTQTFVRSPEEASSVEGTLSERLEAFERAVLKKELDAAQGNVAQAAVNLGIDRSNLHKKLKSYELLPLK